MNKSIFVILLTAFCLTMANASDPVISEKCCPVVVSSAEVNFSYNEQDYNKYLLPAYFNQETNSLHFEAFEGISFIEIFDAAGELKYKLPVMSNKVRISKKMFEKGDYKVQFELENNPDALITYVTINN